MLNQTIVWDDLFFIGETLISVELYVCNVYIDEGMKDTIMYLIPCMQILGIPDYVRGFCVAVDSVVQ